MTDAQIIDHVGRALYGDQYRAALARALGVSKDTVQDWVQGRMCPRPGVWADLLNVVENRRDALEAAYGLLISKMRA